MPASRTSSVPVGRGRRMAAAAGLLATILSTAGTASAGLPTDGDAPAVDGPHTVYPDGGVGRFYFAVTGGAHARCGPDPLTGDGWQCPEPHRPNKVEFSARVPPESAPWTGRHMTVELYATPEQWSAPRTEHLLSRRSMACGRAWCNDAKVVGEEYGGGYWQTWEGVAGGYLWGRIVYDYTHSYSGAAGTWDSGVFGLGPDPSPTCPCPADGYWMGGVRTASEVVNQAPETWLLVGPHHGQTVRRTDREHALTVGLAIWDAESHNVRSIVEVYDPAGVRFYRHESPTLRSAPDHDLRPPVYTTSPPVLMPHRNGVYTVRAWAVDTSGTATSRGPVYAATFTFIWNSSPSVPTPVAPRADERVAPGQPVAFEIRSSDAERDEYAGTVVVYDRAGRKVATAETTSARSGESSFGFAAGLPAGHYTWAATTTDVHGAKSAKSQPVPFTVG